MENKNIDILIGLLFILGLIVIIFSLYIAFDLYFYPGFISDKILFSLLIAVITIIGMLHFFKKNN